MHIKFMTQGVAMSLTHSVASNRQREIGEFNVDFENASRHG
jgi:hypothetical protein